VGVHFKVDRSRREQSTTNGKKENAMNADVLLECGVCYFQGMSKDFTPVTSTADCAAPECPRCKNNDAAFFEKIQKLDEVKAA
jgi:uncharacterized CHY-type Zn-finger protein